MTHAASRSARSLCTVPFVAKPEPQALNIARSLPERAGLRGRPGKAAPFRSAGRRLAICVALALLRPVDAAVTEEAVSSPAGRVYLVRPADAPKGPVLLLPSAAGWDGRAVAVAREVAEQGHLVAALEWSARETGPCWDLGRDLAGLAGWLAGREALPTHAPPTLVGLSDGAALTYAALLQSPPHRFHAAVTLGFCPRWPAARPACQVGGLTEGLVIEDRLAPAARVPTPWLLLPGGEGTQCPGDGADAFAAQVGNAHWLAEVAGSEPDATRPADGERPGLGSLASLMQWLDPRIPDQLGTEAAEADIAGLPLREVRADQPDRETFAVMLSGDGGWAALDRAVAAALAKRGVDTVGWDSLGYFWKARTQTELAHDLERVVRHYLSAWHKERVVLAGYSFGADALPFAANRLPEDLRDRVALVALLGLGRTAVLEFHLSDWLKMGRGADALPILPQIEALRWARSVCVYGAEERESLCPELTKLGTIVREMPGDHHFDGDYSGVADQVLRALDIGQPTARP